MKIALYFGSFNPIHIGHLIIAEFVYNNIAVEQVWFVLSPQNPLKPSKSLLNAYNRLYLLQLAIEDNPAFQICDVEFKLPVPSYTIDTLAYLHEKYPQHEFEIIMGSDSYRNLPKWKNYEVLIAKYKVIVYERPGFNTTIPDIGHIVLLKGTPMLDISATQIRNQLKEKKSVRYMLPEKVYKEIVKSRYYL